MISLLWPSTGTVQYNTKYSTVQYKYKYRFPIVINEAEPAVHLAVKAHAPNLIQFEGWVHRFKDMDRYMRQKGYGAHAVGYFKVFFWSTSLDHQYNPFCKGLRQISADVRVSWGHDR